MKFRIPRVVGMIALAIAVGTLTSSVNATGVDLRQFNQMVENMEWDNAAIWAASHLQWDLVHLFLHPNYLRKDTQYRVLKKASYYGDLESVKRIVNSGINPFDGGAINDNALMQAAKGNQYEIINFLLKVPQLKIQHVLNALNEAINRGNEGARVLLESYLQEN